MWYHCVSYCIFSLTKHTDTIAITFHYSEGVYFDRNKYIQYHLSQDHKTFKCLNFKWRNILILLRSKWLESILTNTLNDLKGIPIDCIFPITLCLPNSFPYTPKSIKSHISFTINISDPGNISDPVRKSLTWLKEYLTSHSCLTNEERCHTCNVSCYWS